ncbi:MAG: DsrE family protein [Gammaproteobacteria bacterium]
MRRTQHQKGRRLIPAFLFAFFMFHINYGYSAEVTYTPYTDQKVIFDFYFDDPQKINSALFWIRSLMNPLIESPYNQDPEFMDIKVMVHGRELVTLAKSNYAKYEEAVERMKYYASLGVQFKVCAIAINDFGYSPKDFHDFVQVVPSAMTELVHWQMKGYGLITPQILFKNDTNENIR